MKEIKEKNTAKDSRTQSSGKKMTSKQIVAMIGVILLVLMYIAALIAAIVDSSASGRLFWVCLYATVVIPLLIWIYTWMYGKLTQKHTFADFDVNAEAHANNAETHENNAKDSDTPS